jgi:Uncharacterised nucleotidyltransferase
VQLSLERRLLLACARARLTAEECQRISELAVANLDWTQLAAVSYAQGIAPLVHHSLVESDAMGLVPTAVAQMLRSSYYANAARNALLYSDLKELLLAFGQEKIAVIGLKGAVLAEIVYPHRALRPMWDIDLLVRRERLADVESQLLSMGYAVDASTREYHREHHYHLAFTKGASPSIEIHWHVQRPASPFRIDIDTLWERSRETRIAGVEALVFSVEHLVLHLCQHFWKHYLAGGVRPLCDVSEVAKCYCDSIDWTEVARASSDWGMNSCSYLVLWLAQELLGAPVPADFLRNLRPVNFNLEAIDWAMEAVLGCGECPLVFPDLIKLFWKGRSARERWAILQKTISRSTVAGYVNDPTANKRAYLYYPLRMKHLLTQYGPVVGRLWTGNQRIRAAAETELKQQRLTKWISDASGI